MRASCKRDVVRAAMIQQAANKSIDGRFDFVRQLWRNHCGRDARSTTSNRCLAQARCDRVTKLVTQIDSQRADKFQLNDWFAVGIKSFVTDDIVAAAFERDLTTKD